MDLCVPALQSVQLCSPTVSFCFPAAQAVHSPPGRPKNPAAHRQSAEASLPAGEVALSGQSTQVEFDADATSDEYLPAWQRGHPSNTWTSHRLSGRLSGRSLPDKTIHKYLPAPKQPTMYAAAAAAGAETFVAHAGLSLYDVFWSPRCTENLFILCLQQASSRFQTLTALTL